MATAHFKATYRILVHFQYDHTWLPVLTWLPALPINSVNSQHFHNSPSNY